MTRRPTLPAALVGTLALAMAGCGSNSSANGGHFDGGASGGSTGLYDASSRDGAGGFGGGTTGSGGTTGAGGSAGRGGSGGTATDAGAAGSGGGTGAGGSGPTCAVALSPVSFGSFDGVPAGPNATLRVRGVITGNAQPATPVWAWTVTLVNNTVSIPVTMPDPQDPSVIEFPITQEGQYVIVVTVGGSPPCGNTQTVGTTLTPSASYWVRVLPPRTRTDLAPSETWIMVSAGKAMARTFNFDHTSSVSIDPAAAVSGDSISSFVLVTSPQHTWSREGDTMLNAFTTLLPDDSTFVYDVLVAPIAPMSATPPDPSMPTQPAFAPLFFPGSTVAHIGALPLTMITPGTPITGTLSVAGGAAVAGASVVLRAGPLTSTVDQSDAAGAFSLLARPGNFSAAIVAPDAALLPEAHVDADATSAIAVPASSFTPMTLGFVWRSDLPTSPLALTLVSSAGGPAGAVDVQLDSDPGALPDVGTLQVTAGATGNMALTATGAVHRTATTDANGAVSFPALPHGAYHLTAVPPVASGDGLTVVAVDLRSSAPPTTLAVNLLPKVAITGTIANVPAGARILILDDQPTLGHVFPAAAVGGGGAYTLRLDPQHAYHLLVDPPAGQGASRVALGPLATLTAARQVNFAFPHMLAFTGVTRTSDGSTAVAGARVQVFCIGPGPDCVDRSQLGSNDPLPLIEGLTDDSGAFALWVPDPALPPSP